MSASSVRAGKDVDPRVKVAGGDGLLPDTAILEMKKFGDNLFTGG